MTGPLITVDELARRVGEPDLRVADTRWYLGEPERGRNAFAAGHIAGATYVDLERDLSAADGPGRHPLPDAAAFAGRLGELGIGSSHVVVAYDDRGGAVAARLWWMLRALGHEQVTVLDGGLAAWRSAGLPEAREVATYPPAHYEIHHGFAGTIDRDGVRRRLGSLTLLDARSGDRYRGEHEPIDPVAGHIPTAITAPYEDNLSPDGRFLSPDALAEKYRALGAAAGLVAAYCGSGVTACHTLLALEIAGIGNAVLYPGSWSDWGGAGYRVATGEDPGSAR